LLTPLYLKTIYLGYTICATGYNVSSLSPLFIVNNALGSSG
jgi:hypothetical protein